MNRWLRQQSRLLLVPLLAWLFGQLAMTGIGATAAPAGPAEGVPGVGTILICTPNGLRTIAVSDIAAADDKGAGNEHPSIPERGYCPWCQVAGSVLLPSPMVQGAVCCRASIPLGSRTVGPLVAAYNAADGFQSRAPPARDVSVS